MKRLVIALLVALLLGALLGRSLAPSSGGRAATPSRGAARPPAEKRSGSSLHSASGAAIAVATYQREFATPSILRPGVLRKRIEAAATPSYAQTMLAANSPGAERLARGPLGIGIRGGVRTLYAAVPIGYRIESYSPAHARVLTWGFTLVGNADAVEPAAYFGLTHTYLAWMGGRWRIAETRGGFGPTPELATQPGPLGSSRVIDVMAGLKSYVLAP
jgi:hypothetical protein